MDLKLPDLGEGVAEGEIARWLVAPGDTVKEDQVILEVMTDKATVEIPTLVGGTVTELFAQEGEVVNVGTALARISNGDESDVPKAEVASVAAPKQTTAPVGVSVTAPLTNAGSIQAAPAVRKLAREKGVDLTGVKGSGPKGRILLADLDGSSPAAAAPAAVSPTAQNSISAPIQPRRTPGTAGPREERVPVRGLRKRIVAKMAESTRTAAHFTCVDEIDVTELVEFRNSIKEQVRERGVNVTFMPFIAKACVFALRKFPMLNSSFQEDGSGGGEIIVKHYYNIGIAADTPDGLTVPVVHDVDQKTFLELAADINDVGKRARERKLDAKDFVDGTFTISNAGKIGGLFATPIINYPEVAILGVHEIRKRPMVVNDEIKIRQVMYLSISIDHRVVDGAAGVQFLNEVGSYLSNPKTFLLEMF